MITDFIYFVSKHLEKEIGKLTPGTVKPYWSDGLWSQHELLIYLLSISGPAKVYISTYSISEIALRSFLLALDEKTITELDLILDYTMKKHKLNLVFFADNLNANVNLLPNHSKLILIENDKWKISCVGSANMSPNPRKEAGAIFTDESTFYHFKERFLKAAEDGEQLEF